MKKKTVLNVFYALVCVLLALKCWMECTIGGDHVAGTLIGCCLGILIFIGLSRCDFVKIYNCIPVAYMASIIVTLALKTPLGMMKNGVLWDLYIGGIPFFRPANLLFVTSIAMLGFLHDKKVNCEKRDYIWIGLDFLVISVSGSLIDQHAHSSVMAYFLLISSVYLIYCLVKWYYWEYIFSFPLLLYAWAEFVTLYKWRWFGSEQQLAYNVEEAKRRFDLLNKGGLFGTGKPSEYLNDALYSADNALFVFSEIRGALVWILFTVVVLLLACLSIYFGIKSRNYRIYGPAEFVISCSVGLHLLATEIMYVYTAFSKASIYVPVLHSDRYLTCIVFAIEMILVAVGAKRWVSDQT